MSVRDSYRVYSVGLYLLDFGSLLTCLFAVDALTRDIKPFRYDPEFWYFLAVLWALYATWDIMMFYKEEAPSYRKQLKVWTLYMVSASCMLTLICAMVLQQVGTNLSSTTNYCIFLGARIIPGLFMVYAVVSWLMTVNDKFVSTEPGRIIVP